MLFPPLYRPCVRGLAITLCALVSASAFAGEIELKSLASLKGDDATKKKYGPYVGFFGGTNKTLTGDATIGGVPFSLNDFDGGSTYGIEVGKSWKSKRYPLMMNLEFEASFANNELSGQASPETLDATTIDPITGLAVPLIANNGLAGYKTDMNSVFFMLNGSVSLDLYRYRARLGKFIAGLRPYVGGGIGGGQLWFRNTITQSKDQLTGVNPLTTSTGFPFAVDDFVNAWQWFGGIEYTWKDKYSIYAEYREFHYGELEEVEDLTTSGWALGYRYRY
ncbi:MAG: hypothetical protein ACOYOF_15115 [Verrucomicrobiaceae bacterium]